MLLRYHALVTLLLAPSLSGATLPDKIEFEAKLDKSFQVAEQALETLPMEKVDLVALQRSLGTDPERLRNWVAQNIRWVPYRGTLKGAQGTLLALAGNSLDCALLLARLLQSAGKDNVRIASLPLNQVARDRLRVKAAESFEHLRVEARVLKAGNTEGKELLARFKERLKSQPQRLSKIIPLTGNTVPVETWVDRGLQQYFWVEYQIDPVTWKRLDLFSDNRLVNDATATPVYFTADAVPKKLHHKVTFKVIVHRESEGRVTQHTALQHELNAAEHVLGQVRLAIAPLNLPSDEVFAELVGRPKEAETFIRAAFEGIEKWVPTLTVGKGQPIVQKGFDYTGNLIDNPSTLLATNKKTFGNVLDQLNDLLVSVADESGKKSQLAKVSVEYRVSGPGVETRTIRRVLFDRETSPKPLDRSCDLSRETSILIQTGALPPEWTVRQQAENLLGVRLASRFLINAKDANQAGQRMMKIAGKINTVPLNLVVLASARDLGTGYLAEANLLSTWQSSRYQDGKLKLATEIDILHNRVSSNRPQDGFQSGIRDSILESFIVDSSKSRSTSNRFQAATLPWQLIQDKLSLRRVSSGNKKLQVVLQEELQQGFHLVMANGTTGRDAFWWRINPESGETLGMVFDASGIRGGMSVTQKIILEYAIVWPIRIALWGACVGNGGDVFLCGMCALLGKATGAANKASFALKNINIGGLVPGIAGAGASAGCFSFTFVWDYISP